MFALEVETEFSAAHALTIGGTRERTHGHNFRVTVTITGKALDPDGLLCDFHAVERWLADIVGPFRDGDLNSTPPFDRINPSAERIAEHIGIALARKLAPGLRVEGIRITEASGCAATYRPDSA